MAARRVFVVFGSLGSRHMLAKPIQCERARRVRRRVTASKVYQCLCVQTETERHQSNQIQYRKVNAITKPKIAAHDNGSARLGLAA